MTSAIICRDASFDRRAAGLLPPHVERAQAYYLFGTDAAHSLVNRVPGATVHPTANGTVTYGAGYASVSSRGTPSVRSGIVGGNPYTQIIVASTPTGTTSGAILCGHYWVSPSTERMDSLYSASNSGAAAAYSTLGDLGTWRTYGTTPIATNTGYNFVAGVYDGAVGGTMFGAADALQDAWFAAADATPSGTRDWWIGGSGFVGVGGDFNVAAAMLFHEVLTLDEIAEIYAYFRTLMPGRGILLN